MIIKKINKFTIENENENKRYFSSSNYTDEVQVFDLIEITDKKKYNFRDLQLFFRDKFIEVVPILVKNKDITFLKNYFTDFYSNLINDLDNIDFVSDANYDNSRFLDIKEVLNYMRSRVSIHCIETNTYKIVFDFFTDEITFFIISYMKNKNNLFIQK
jgi:hypothetical protein